MAWGASVDDWNHLDLILGLGEDLLPIVSDPTAAISPLSSLREVGKVPSLFNTQGQAIGLKDWPQRKTTPREIARWAADDRLGIGLQTRQVRAIDIDVGDQDKADAIACRVMELLPGMDPLPMRWRKNSGKKLLLVRSDGIARKESFKCDGGMVELLSHGQQFIVAGTHPSGVRYQWAGGLPDNIPVLGDMALDRLWRVLAKEFATETVRVSTPAVRGGAGVDGDRADDVADWLEEHWPNHGRRDGKLDIECPWKDNHSSDNGPSQTSWMLAGTGGKEVGHFNCMHQGCKAHSETDFLDAVGYRVAQFDDLGALYQAEVSKAVADGKAPPAALKLPLPGFKRDKTGQHIEAVIENVVRGVEHPEVTGLELRFDEFAAEMLLSPQGKTEWRPFRDADNVRIRLALAKIGFRPVSKDMVRDAVVLVGDEKRFDTAITWLTEVVPVWDGVERIERSLSTYFKASDTPYTRACGLYVWTAMAGRVMSPGCQVDMAMVLVSPQGYRKSSGIASLSPSSDFFGEVNLEHRDADLSRKLRGKLVIELAELRGLKSRESESIKAWITQRREEWTPKYMEHGVVFPRRCVLWGTTNDDEFLGDPTGERRWLPARVHGQADVEAIERDRLQLWAEARERWGQSGVLWSEAERLAKVEHKAFKEKDPWEAVVSDWLREDTLGVKPMDAGHLRSHDVLTGALGFDAKHIGKREEMRIGKVLRDAGLKRVDAFQNGKTFKAWVKDENEG